MKKVKFLYDKIMEITGQVGKDHVGAYAAQAAYFFMLSLIPIILLLITLVQPIGNNVWGKSFDVR